MKDLIWYEKHRPGQIEEMVLPANTRETFEEFINKKEIPHLLLYGPRGSGKTSLAKILIKHCANSCLTLNASSEDRGIMTVKTKVKEFARSKSMGDKKRIVFLDEADGLTPDAQIALKNTIETYHENCRFIMTANNLHRIIVEIQSRCMPFEFHTLKEKEVARLTRKILDKENIGYDKKDLRKLVKEFTPDVRSIINKLQAGSVGGKFNLKKANLFLDGIDKNKLAKYIVDGKEKTVRSIFNDIGDFAWFYKWLYDEFLPSNSAILSMIKDDKTTADIYLQVAEYMYRDRYAILKEINAFACALEIMMALNIEIEF